MLRSRCSSSSSMLLFILVIASMYAESMVVLKFLSLNFSIQEKRKKKVVPNCPCSKLPHPPMTCEVVIDLNGPPNFSELSLGPAKTDPLYALQTVNGEFIVSELQNSPWAANPRRA
jgi:hypothetical protein